MSWSLSASGHAEVTQAEQLLLSDLKEVFARHKDILSALSFTGAGGTLQLADIVAEDVVIPLVRPVFERVEDEAKKLMAEVKDHFDPSPGSSNTATPSGPTGLETTPSSPAAPADPPQPEGSLPAA